MYKENVLLNEKLNGYFGQIQEHPGLRGTIQVPTLQVSARPARTAPSLLLPMDARSAHVLFSICQLQGINRTPSAAPPNLPARPPSTCPPAQYPVVRLAKRAQTLPSAC